MTKHLALRKSMIACLISADIMYFFGPQKNWDAGLFFVLDKMEL